MEVVFLLQNNCNFEKARTTNILEKHFFLDLVPEGISKDRIDPIDLAEEAFHEGKPRILKLHSPKRFLEKPVLKLSSKIQYLFYRF